MNGVEVLTREDAILRIREIKNLIQIDHHRESDDIMISLYGAINELMAIFDIHEDEL